MHRRSTYKDFIKSSNQVRMRVPKRSKKYTHRVNHLMILFQMMMMKNHL